MTNWVQNKKEYRIFCQEHPEMPIFFQGWWLDTVCDNGHWEVCLSKDKGGNVWGVLPFFLSRSYGFQVIKMPDLTPYLGVWIKYPLNKEKKEALYRFEKKVLAALIEQIPKVAYYAQRHPPQLVNGLPFLWEGFKQTTRFTYRVTPLEDLDTTYDMLKGSVRTEIRKAEKEVEILESEDISAFYSLQEKSFERQNLKVPYSWEFLKKMDAVLKQKNRRKLLIARDKDGNHHAAVYLVWDGQCVYNLMQGADPQFGNSGAIKYLLWEGIKFAHYRQLSFDFEGGMMPNIESVFSAFGGVLTPYHKIYKGGNWIFRLLSAIKNR